MPYKEKSIEKLYYTIGEISEILGESTSLVRFWAQKFPDFIKPARNKKGNRLFTAQDLANFKIIYHLVKECGMTLDGANKRMKENIGGEDKRRPHEQDGAEPQTNFKLGKRTQKGKKFPIKSQEFNQTRRKRHMRLKSVSTT